MFGLGQLLHQPDRQLIEFGSIGLGNGFGRFRFDFKRVDRRAVMEHPEVEMGAGGDSGTADVADHFPLPHPFAFFHAPRKATHMDIGGFIVVGMADADFIAVIAIIAFLSDGGYVSKASCLVYCN